MKKNKGWRQETTRHSLAARGIKTKKKPIRIQVGRKLYKPVLTKEEMNLDNIPEMEKKYEIKFLSKNPEEDITEWLNLKDGEGKLHGTA